MKELKTEGKESSTMPEIRYTNGFSPAAELGAANEFHDGDLFLFSSESVGEGHPGKTQK